VVAAARPVRVEPTGEVFVLGATSLEAVD